MPWAIIAHGGAGAWQESDIPAAHTGLLQALEAGGQRLRAGGSALDACEAAICILEDLPLFNAGLGSVLNSEGDCEMDACLMQGATLQVGACAGVRRVKHPITLARRIMERSAHVLIAGEGAERLAKEWRLEERDPRTPQRIQQWQRFTGRSHPAGAAPSTGNTVGCVALDLRGRIVAGTSTGGMAMKLPGRIGDSPIPGAGVYSTPTAGVSCTGDGEMILRVLLAKEPCDRIAQGMNPEAACEDALGLFKDKTASSEAGLIALSNAGEFGVGRSASAMPVAYWRDGMGRPETRR